MSPFRANNWEKIKRDRRMRALKTKHPGAFTTEVTYRHSGMAGRVKVDPDRRIIEEFLARRVGA